MSLNKTKIEWTDITWNPITGCLHNCWYCLDGDTQITMSDLSFKKLRDIKIGDEILGVNLRKDKSKIPYLQTSIVQSKNKIRDEAYKIITETTILTCSSYHKWLVDRMRWRSLCDTLKVGSKIRLISKYVGVEETTGSYYMRGYLRGIIKGDGCLGIYKSKERKVKVNNKTYTRPPENNFKFRLSMKDFGAIKRARDYLKYFGVNTFNHIHDGLFSIRKDGEASYHKINEIISIVNNPEFKAGYLGGIFDAEGSYSGNILRLYNKDVSEIINCLDYFGFEYHVAKDKIGVFAITFKGGFEEHLRFFNISRPAIKRKRTTKISLRKGHSRIISIENIGIRELYDIQTSTENFIANGVVSHNCYAKKMFTRFHKSFKPTFHPERLKEIEKLKKPSKIFICSVADIFAEWTNPEWTRQVIDTINKYPQHEYQLLTKNPERIDSIALNLRNCWVGATINYQNELMKNLGAIKCIDCKIKFISFEPLLENIDFSEVDLRGIDWIIVGKLTGSKKIKLQEIWVENILSKARENDIPIFIKNNVKWKDKIQEFPKKEK